MTIQLKGMSFSQTGLETLKKKYKRNKEKKGCPYDDKNMPHIIWSFLS